MEGIAAWWAAQPWWWMEFWDTAGHVYSPVGMVEKLVVAAAERDAVVDAGGAVVSPMDNVVNFGPAGWYRTPWKGASAVSDNDDSAYCGGYGVAGATDVERNVAATRRS
ncbi:MAG: hypothetical protein WCC65_06960 [Pseudonocardiaceae bacterium]